MLGNISIKTTHIGQCIVNIGVVHRFQGTYLAGINAYDLLVTLRLGLHVVGNIQCIKTLKPDMKSAINTTKQKISDIIGIIDISNIIIIKLTRP